MNETAIAWTDYTWNLFSGCKKISPECAHCYADSLAEKRRGTPAFPHGFDLTVRPHKLSEPARLLRTKGPALIFCESMSDIGLEDEELSPDERARLAAAGFTGMDHLRDVFFDMIEDVPEHRYQVLTKRMGRLLRYFRERGRPGSGRQHIPESVWLGVTCGHPKSLGRVDELREARRLGARVLFVSAEPLLGDLVAADLRLDGIDWAIGGGESGNHVSNPKNAERFLVAREWRPSHPRHHVTTKRFFGPWRPTAEGLRWVCDLRDLAHAAGTAFFFKQWGGPTPSSGGRLLDGRTWDEMPTAPGAMPARRTDLGGASTAALARKRLPVAP